MSSGDTTTAIGRALAEYSRAKNSGAGAENGPVGGSGGAGGGAASTPGPAAAMIAALPPKPLRRVQSRLVPRVPARMCLYGKTRSGKTYFLIKLLESPENPWDVVVWCAPKASLHQRQIKNLANMLNGTADTPDGSRLGPLSRGAGAAGTVRRFYTLEGDTRVGLTPANAAVLDALTSAAHKNKLQVLVVFDDLMSSKCHQMTDLFTAGRHKGVSVATLQQRVFTGDNAERTRRLNAEYHVIFDLGSVGQMEQLAMQLDRSSSPDVVDAYRQVMRRRTPGKYLLIDREAASSPDRTQRLLSYRDSALDRVFAGLADLDELSSEDEE